MTWHSLRIMDDGVEDVVGLVAPGRPGRPIPPVGGRSVDRLERPSTVEGRPGSMSYRACMRSAPSRRMVSPLSIEFATIAMTS